MSQCFRTFVYSITNKQAKILNCIRNIHELLLLKATVSWFWQQFVIHNHNRYDRNFKKKALAFKPDPKKITN